MSTLVDVDLGRIWLPNQARSVAGQPCKLVPVNIVKAKLFRPKWSIRDVIKLPEQLHPLPDGRSWLDRMLAPFIGQIDPALFQAELIWASFTANERVNMGASIQHNLIFGTVGTAANGVCSAMAVASADITKTATDLSLGSASANATTNEFTTIGLSRTTATIQNYVAASSLNGTASSDAYKSFSCTGSGTAYGVGLFDSTTVNGSHLLQEDKFTSAATVVNGDTLNVTYTSTE